MVMLQEASDNNIDISLFDELGRYGRKAIERFKMGEQASVEFLIIEVCGQSLRLKYPLKIV